jgi:hypothetical protein
MLDLAHLRQDQYRQVAEWEFGPQPDGTDWHRYEAEMNAPQWVHFGIYSAGAFIGALSLEINRQTAEFHVVTARHAVRPRDLAKTLLDAAGRLFHAGFTSMIAKIPKKKAAAIRLAIRCGMMEYGHTPSDRRFILTQSRFQRFIDGK